MGTNLTSAYFAGFMTISRMVYVWMCPIAHAGLQDVKLCFHRATEEPMENKCDEQVAAKALGKNNTLCTRIHARIHVFV